MTINNHCFEVDVWTEKIKSFDDLKDKEVTVLIVDDDPQLRNLLIEYFTEFLPELNTNITIANNGCDALKIINKQSFSLVITDYNMPELNGLELIEAIHASNKQDSMKKIFMTGGGHNSDILKALSLSDAYIFKPIDFGHLTDIILSSLGKNTLAAKTCG